MGLVRQAPAVRLQDFLQKRLSVLRSGVGGFRESLESRRSNKITDCLSSAATWYVMISVNNPHQSAIMITIANVSIGTFDDKEQVEKAEDDFDYEMYWGRELFRDT